MRVQVADYVAELEQHGPVLRAAAASAGLDARVPTCPDWQVRDLLAHVGRTHRWATSFVATGRTEPPRGDGELAAAPGDDALLDWFTAGHGELVRSLRTAPAQLECWSFLPAPSPLAFWARRQAHETAIHRVDAQLAAGQETTIGTRFAVDGIDELLLGFFSRRRSRLISDPPVVLGVRTTDGEDGAAWTVTVGPASREVTRGTARGDCVVSGPAASLYLLLWNRADVDTVDLSGDEQVLDLWRRKATVTWT
jgi:uncharacterized protein (TIGR03083 family)